MEPCICYLSRRQWLAQLTSFSFITVFIFKTFSFWWSAAAKVNAKQIPRISKVSQEKFGYISGLPLTQCVDTLPHYCQTKTRRTVSFYRKTNARGDWSHTSVSPVSVTSATTTPLPSWTVRLNTRICMACCPAQSSNSAWEAKDLFYLRSCFKV